VRAAAKTSAVLRVHLLGRPRLSVDDVSFPIAGRPKVVPLLGYLLLHRAAPLARRAVASALWPDDAEDAARANLRRHLHYLETTLPPARGAPWIVATPTTVQWNPAIAMRFDVDDLERLGASPDTRADALHLYAGDLLEELDEAWIEPERERLRGVYRTIALEHVAALRAARDFAPAIAAAQALLARDPWQEHVLRTLIGLRYESGDRAGALAEFERFAQRLSAELQAEPMAETRAVYEAIARDDAPPPAVAGRDGARDGAGAASPGPLPFVGREADLDALTARADAAAGGRGGLVLVAGEAGIGKTRLVRECATRCETRGMLTLTATTTAPERMPYEPFVTALRGVAPLIEHAVIDPLWRRAIAPLAPAIGEGTGALATHAPSDPQRDRLRMFEACVAVWTTLARRRPIVLIVEDVHAAGPATLALLEHLARAAPAMRMLLVATYREDELEASHPLRAMRRVLEREALATTRALQRLTRADVARAIAPLGIANDADAMARELHACSDGNPLFLEELVRDFAETGRLHDHARSGDASPAAMPPAMRALVRERLANLGDGARTVAEIGSVIGRAFDVELLREAAGWHEAEVLDALGELASRRIVRERTAFDYAFTHHLIQTVVYDEMPPPARARRHRRIAQVLEALHAETADTIAGELAMHWDRAGEPRRAASRYLAAARRALDVYGNAEADALLERVLALEPSPRERFEALLLRERLAASAGDRALQSRLLDTAAHLARGLDDDAACTVLVRRVEMASVTADRRRERVTLRALGRRVDRCGDVRHRVAWLEGRARHFRAMNDFAAARATFADLIELTREAGDRGAYASARVALADTFVYEGRLGDAYAILDDLRGAVTSEGDRVALARTLIAMSRAALAQQDYAAMSRFAAESHALSIAIGDREGEALALHTMANGLVYTFAVAEAEAHYAHALEIYERIGHRVGLASIFVDLGLFHTELGLIDRALALYARARTLAADVGSRFVACVERIDAAYAYRLRGDAADARACATEALAIARAIPSTHLESAALGTLAAAETALGDCTAAIAHAREAVELRRPSGATPRLGDNLCALAHACVRAGDRDAAAAASAELLALYDANPKLAPQPTEWLWTAAQVELANGRTDAALALLRQAASVMAARAAAIDDAATREAYLALPFNRAVERELAAV